MDFTSINTQEEFDARVRELYGDVTGLQGQIETLTGERDTHAATIAQLQGQIKGFETDALKRQIAGEKGLPLEFASRLTGDNEADIKADADRMTGLLRAYKGAAPLAEPAPNTENTNRAHLRGLLGKMKGE